MALVKPRLLRGPGPLSDEYFVLLSPQERIRLARQIEKAEYRNFQACLHNSWMEQAAAALEIELEEDMYKGVPGTGGDGRLCPAGFPFNFYLLGSILPSVIHQKHQGASLVHCLLLPCGPSALSLSYVSDSPVDSPWSPQPGADTNKTSFLMQPVLLLCG